MLSSAIGSSASVSLPSLPSRPFRPSRPPFYPCFVDMPLIFDLRYVSCGLLARSVYCGRVAVASEQAATSSLALAARATSSKSGKREKGRQERV
jgi:hypothetical protein